MSPFTQSTAHPLSEDEARLAEASSQALRHLLDAEESLLPQTTVHMQVGHLDGATAEILLPSAALPCSPRC